jgi:hypothetical protein
VGDNTSSWKCLGDEENDSGPNFLALNAPDGRPKLYTHVKISSYPMDLSYQANVCFWLKVYKNLIGGTHYR